MKSTFIKLTGIGEVKSDKETRLEVLQEIDEIVNDDCPPVVEAIIVNYKGKKLLVKLDECDIEMFGEVFDEEGVIID